MAAGTIVVVLIALLGSLTVLPAVLVLLGDRIDRGRLPRILRLRRRDRSGGVWGRLASGVTRRPAVALVAVGALLVALALPALGMRTGDPGVDSLPPETPLRQSVAAVETAFPGAPDSVGVVVRGRRLTPTRPACGHSAGGPAPSPADAAPSTSPSPATAGRRWSRCRPRRRTRRAPAAPSRRCATRWR